MAPEAFLVLGVLMILGALTALAVSLDFGASTRGLVRARLRRAVAPADAQRADGKAQLVVRSDNLGILRLFIRASGLRKLDRDLVLAGRASTWRISTLVMLKVIGPAILFLPLTFWLHANPSIVRLGLMIGIFTLVYALPNIVVRGRASERQAKILYELPDVLDQVTISIESGLGFEAALARVGQNGKGPLAAEVVRVGQDSRLGMSRRDAYQALADRTEVDDLKRFLKSIVQAEEFGVSISKVVRTQADELRTKRRQRAEEKAAKVALKLLFPMLACMFPVLFILILTPAIINMGKVL